MLRTRLYLGLLPLLLLFIAVSAVATLMYRNLSRSLEQSLTVNYRSMIAGYEMRDAANLMTGAVMGARQGDIPEARAAYGRERSRFQQQFMEQSLRPSVPARAALLEKIDAAFRALDALAKGPLEDGGDASLAALRDTELARFRLVGAIEDLAKQDYGELQAGAERAARLAKASINFLFGATSQATLLPSAHS